MFGFDDDFTGFMLTNDAHDDAEREEREKALEEERKKLEQEKQEELYKSSALFPDDDEEEDYDEDSDYDDGDYDEDDEDSDYDDDERDNGEMTIAEIRNLMTILGIRKNNPADEEEEDEDVDDEDEDNENENQNEEEEGNKYKYKALLLGFDYHCEEDYLKHIKKGDTFLLIPEPENPYDHNAIAAYKEGELRAYVMRADAKRLHNVVKEPTECYVTLVSFNSVYVGFDV